MSETELDLTELSTAEFDESDTTGTAGPLPAEGSADAADAADATDPAAEPEGVPFAQLELPGALLDVLREAGVTRAFPIQAATIPDALAGRDVLGRGRTGSGKTLAFGLPTLTRLEGLRARPHKPLALVLVPTRELAMQVEESLRPYARALRLRIRSVFGGAPMRKQIDGLRYGVEVLVATPGRLSDLIERGECELGDVDIAILDEADQMCDMGFLPHVCELMDQVAEGGQRLLFSATLDGAVDEIVTKYMKDPVLHEVDPHAGVVSTMSHHLLLVTPQHKARVAAQIAGRHSVQAQAAARTIFFVRTQLAADRVTEQFRERGLAAAALHGGMTQVARTKTLEDFKDGRTPVLIATDVAARGIHVDGVDLVVHVDPPRDSKDYLHRAGRTARAGQAGIVASLILPKQTRAAERLMRDAGVEAESLDVAPIGAGGKWEKAAAALADLTAAQEVPEPGEVPVFTLPARERDRGGRGDERGFGDRGRREGRGGFGDRDFRGRREERGGFGDRPRRDERGNFPRRDRDERSGGFRKDERPGGFGGGARDGRGHRDRFAGRGA
jgi:superfamily II DNA/RNA helicase